VWLSRPVVGLGLRLSEPGERRVTPIVLGIATGLLEFLDAGAMAYTYTFG
jgi:hypothetical protein